MNSNKKIVTITLTRIKYTGADIGPNFSLIFKLGDFQGETKKKIYNGKVKRYKERAVQAFVLNSKAVIPLEILVSESDPRVDDIGNVTLKIDLSKLESKIIATKVLVKGYLFEKDKIANLELAFDVTIDDGIRYIQETSDGWLQILQNNGKKLPLPTFLKVALHNSTKERDYFKILEGPHTGKKGSVLEKGNGHSYLIVENPQRSEVKLRLYLSKKILWVVGLGKFKVAEVDESFKPLKVGKYEIEIPSAPHKKMDFYKKYSKFAMTWFRIGHAGDRFVHIGQVSHGCITIEQHRRWTSIARYFLRSRKNIKSIGILEVKK